MQSQSLRSFPPVRLQLPEQGQSCPRPTLSLFLPVPAVVSVVPVFPQHSCVLLIRRGHRCASPSQLPWASAVTGGCWSFPKQPENLDPLPTWSSWGERQMHVPKGLSQRAFSRCTAFEWPRGYGYLCCICTLSMPLGHPAVRLLSHHCVCLSHRLQSCNVGTILVMTGFSFQYLQGKPW